MGKLNLCKEVLENAIGVHKSCEECGLEISPIDAVAVQAMEELLQYREIGTPDECRAAVEKQKEMIAYCEENECTGCPYWNGSQEDNKCMNDFVSEEIAKNT